MLLILLWCTWCDEPIRISIVTIHPRPPAASSCSSALDTHALHPVRGLAHCPAHSLVHPVLAIHPAPYAPSARDRVPARDSARTLSYSAYNDTHPPTTPHWVASSCTAARIATVFGTVPAKRDAVQTPPIPPGSPESRTRTRPVASK